MRVAYETGGPNLVRWPLNPPSPTVPPADARPPALALRLRDFRLRAGLSQQQLADFSTLSVRAIRDIENGRVTRPRQETLDLLMRVLDVEDPRPVPAADDPAHRRTGPATHPGPPPGARAGGPFLDRTAELDALADLFGAGHHRLVTVTGIEGVGKTRTTAEFARSVRQRGDWLVLWIPCGERPSPPDDRSGRSGDPALTLPELVRAGDAGVRHLRDAVAARRALIVFDGARGDREGPALAPVVDALLEGCGRLRVMVTARSPVGIPGESLLPLAPLTLPEPAPDSEADPATVGGSAAVQVFLRHAALLRPGFRLDAHNAAAIAGICHALDGIPAALESAARWSLVYSPHQLAGLLRANPLLVARPPDLVDAGMPPLFDSVPEIVGGLTPRQRRLLTTMSGRRLAWSVGAAAAAAGIDADDCASDVFTLLTLGLLRRRDDGDRAVLEVLNVVRFRCGGTVS
ncbi:helix-turn-helix domain-containing protein [Virgisporangium aurantiacum]|uniref:helix-turn-helix domain-containing protein n=1 Tax=Virgisporangium aurantiacum TaxID=175570 RepID=UPI0019521FCF|nr:helix-turn-helix domain-containing protein [Virgisporangium aurantiacum]